MTCHPQISRDSIEYILIDENLGKHDIGIFEVLEQNSDLGLICRPWEELSKASLHRLHIGDRRLGKDTMANTEQKMIRREIE